MNGKISFLVLYFGLLASANLGQPKLIENETFLWGVRPNVVIPKDIQKVHAKMSTNFNSNQVAIKTNISEKVHRFKFTTTEPTVYYPITIEIPISAQSRHFESQPPSKDLQSSMSTFKRTYSNNFKPKIFSKMKLKTTSITHIDLIRNTDETNPFQEPRFVFSTINSHKTNRSPIDYINYKQAYGIRYDPNKIRRSLKYPMENQTLTENPTIDPVELTTEADDLTVESVQSTDTTETIGSVNIEYDGVATQLPTEVFSNDINEAGDSSAAITLPLATEQAPLEVLETLPNATLVQPNSTTNIMIPSRVQSTIHLIKNRVKQLLAYGLEENESNKNGQRFLNIFNVIRFPNVPCSSRKAPLTSLNGTCYNQDECQRLGGVEVDVCAAGFGVCCVFQYGCGGVTRQNISYFKSPDYPAAYADRLSCALNLVLWPNVKSVLVEFIFFELLPPVDGSCSDDQFLITGHSSNNLVPIFCGINSGQHIYLDVEDSVNRQITFSVFTGSAAPRAFNIRLSQLKDQIPPQGCLQYHKDTTGFVQTFNYEDAAEIVQLRKPSYFNNLNYAICIRRSPGYCVITYSNEIGANDYQFQLINVDEDGTSVIPAEQAGAEIFNCADDYIAVNGIRLCGDRLNDGSVTEDFALNAPVGDYSAGPIVLPVRTNADTVGRGFKLYYEQQPCSMR